MAGTRRIIPSMCTISQEVKSRHTNPFLKISTVDYGVMINDHFENEPGEYPFVRVMGLSREEVDIGGGYTRYRILYSWYTYKVDVSITGQTIAITPTLHEKVLCEMIS